MYIVFVDGQGDLERKIRGKYQGFGLITIKGDHAIICGINISKGGNKIPILCGSCLNDVEG
jgi:hypothetical protein